jgi:hypothetical protein
MRWRAWLQARPGVRLAHIQGAAQITNSQITGNLEMHDHMTIKTHYNHIAKDITYATWE